MLIQGAFLGEWIIVEDFGGLSLDKQQEDKEEPIN